MPEAALKESRRSRSTPGAVRYRVGQFFAALAATVSPPDTELRCRGEVDSSLLTAALLHDAGKAESGVTVLHRVARVVLRRPAAPLWRYLSGWPTGWRRPFWAVAHHAERGAVWVASLGGAPEVVALIRYHERAAPPAWDGTEQGRRHAALTAADELS